MKQSKLIGKIAFITDKEHMYYNEYGKITYFDGDDYHIALWNDETHKLALNRKQFLVRRDVLEFLM